MQRPILPQDVDLLDPFLDSSVMKCLRRFYDLFYDDASTRWMMIGINPGRFGAGVTGIPFTDPIRLESDCCINNDFPKKAELSSIFMYQMMQVMGGPSTFFRKFYITSVSPLGFIQQGKNLNYYDDAALAESIRPFVIHSMEQQLRWPVERSACFCIGEGKNLHYLRQLNNQMAWFKQVVPLPHPRFIMQYKRKSLHAYIDKYLDAFASVGINW